MRDYWLRAAMTGSRVRRASQVIPTYSPEFNPIELWWCDMRRVLRTLALDAEADLRRAARRLRLPLEKIAAWFRFSLRQTQAN